MSIQRRYQLASAGRVILGQKVTEFQHLKQIQVRFAEFSAQRKVMTYELLDQQLEGGGLVHEWGKDIDRLQQRLDLQYSPSAESVSVLNFTDIGRAWEANYREQLANKCTMRGGAEMVTATEKLLQDRNGYEAGLIGYNSLRTLLNPYVKGQADFRPLTLKNYFGSDIDLHLVIEAIDAPDGSLTATAKVDEEKQDMRALTDMMRAISHTIDLKVDLKVEMEEIYTYSALMVPESANLFLSVTVADGWYKSISAHQLQEG